MDAEIVTVTEVAIEIRGWRWMGSVERRSGAGIALDLDLRFPDGKRREGGYDERRGRAFAAYKLGETKFSDDIGTW